MPSSSRPMPPADAADLVTRLTALRAAAQDYASRHGDFLDALPAELQESGRNLLHYLALRQHDIRDLQDALATLGLSRLGRAESHALGSIDVILDALHAMVAARRPHRARPHTTLGDGPRRLAAHATALLGGAPDGRTTRIMVTAPTDAAYDTRVLATLIGVGMNVLRINTAHDTPEEWRAMVRNLRAAEKLAGRSCRVHVDLAGPKLRTGEIEPIGRLAEFKPQRDPMGSILHPARVWLTPMECPQPAPPDMDAVLPVGADLLALAVNDDQIALTDARGTIRYLHLERRDGESWIGLCQQHAYVTEGATCVLRRADEEIASGAVGRVPDLVLPITLHNGDRLWLTRESEPGRLPSHDSAGRLLAPASIPCTLPAVFPAARVGQSILFDDGKIAGEIVAVGADRIEVAITQAGPRGSKLRAGKGINLPDTPLDVPSLTETDLAALDALSADADSIGLSFVRHAADLHNLHSALLARGAREVGIVAKIETRQGFENLPEILMAGMARPPFGVMVARGDLAVEVGFERLAEVQEEIVWLCEAAHVPVIWATQVLENLAKRGLPSRAEVSDAAHSANAECVMLNKGPYIVEATRFLAGVLQRMSGHRDKRAPMLRRLAVTAHALETAPAGTTA